MRGLYERNGIWWISYTDGNGRHRRESTGTRSKAAAVRALEKRRTEIFEGKFFDKQQTDRDVFSDHVAGYLKWSKGAKALRTYIRDTQLAAHLLKAFGELPTSKITPGRIEAYRQMRLEKVSSTTVNREVGLMRHIFNRAIVRDEVKVNPVSKIKNYAE
ncbi:MAG: hypothetical protein JW941_06555 [Candidatus Coatesbacteria bacterium]|nr:hypothetical protein [Candidatus Coatesbacteria bacterium]